MDLDERQRAMLAEMDIRVWWPRTTPEADISAPSPAAAQRIAGAAPTSRMAVAAETAESIAAIEEPERVEALKRSKNQETPALQPLSPGIDSMDWSALQAAVAGCRACKLCEGRHNTVFGVGQAPQTPGQAPHADWLIVGEAPGEREDLAGEPFVGPAGKLLDNMLKAIGLDRHTNVFIANVVKCRPPGNRNPEPEEVAQCAPYLRRQIELLAPKIILAMGRFAVNSLLQETVPEVHKLPLGKLRGQVHRYRGVPVIATYHPAYLLRNLPDKSKAWADLCLALEVMQQPA
ncbi:MAG: uracil-DNA glycosylase [Rhodoferax sp.]